MALQCPGVVRSRTGAPQGRERGGSPTPGCDVLKMSHEYMLMGLDTQRNVPVFIPPIFRTALCECRCLYHPHLTDGNAEVWDPSCVTCSSVTCPRPLLPAAMHVRLPISQVFPLNVRVEGPHSSTTTVYPSIWKEESLFPLWTSYLEKLTSWAPLAPTPPTSHGFGSDQ